MLKKITILLISLLTLTLAGTTWAQTIPPAAQTVTGWQAAYWNNITLSGDPVLSRDETAINHDWGFGSPDPAVTPDRFSARWTGTLHVEPGQYRFTLIVDDGARLWVNDQLLIDSWQVQAESSYTADIYLPGGEIPVRLDYFENTGLAAVRLSWIALSQIPNRWYGEYFNNKQLLGSPVLIRDDAVINFDWGTSSPAADLLDPEAFSARWTRQLDLPAGQYRFTITVDDGARLWVDDQLLLDQWQPQAATRYEREISLRSSGPVPVRLEYYENGGLAELRLSWQRLHDPVEPEAGSIVDVNSTGFVFGGPEAEWNREAEGFNNSLFWTVSKSQIEAQYNWARWFPNLEPGAYEVSAYIPERFSTTAQARYWISHADGYTLRIIDQSANGGQWVSLGIFEFEGSDNDYVSLSAVTFEDDSRLVAFDAMRWTALTAAGQATATADPTLVAPGTAVTVKGTGFPPGQTVYLRLGPPNTEPFGEYGKATAGSDGTVTIPFTVPAAWPGGQPVVETLAADNELVILLISEGGPSALTSLTFQP